MPRESDTQLSWMPLEDLSHGLYSDRGPLHIPPGGASAMSNFVWVEGFLRPRPGLSQVYSPYPSFAPFSATLKHLTQYNPLTGSKSLVRVDTYPQPGFTTFRVQRYDSAMSSWVYVGGDASTGPGAVQDPEAQFSSCNYKGKLYIAYYGAPVIQYDSTSGALPLETYQPDPDLKPPYGPRIIAANDSTLFLADMLDSATDPTATRVPYRVAWCDFLNASIWNGGVKGGESGYQDLVNESEPITGLYANNVVVVAFKAREMYVSAFAGSPRYYAFKSFAKGPGCIAHSTIKEYRDGKIIWLGDDNVYICVPGTQPVPIGDPIRRRIREAAATNVMQRSRAIIDRDRDLYTLFVPRASDSRVLKAFTCNLRLGSWWEWDYDLGGGVDISDGTEYRSGNWSTTQLIATTSNKILQSSLNFTDDAGVTIACTWTSGVLQARQVFRDTEQAQVQMIRIFGQDTGKTVTLGMDYGNGLDRFSSKTFGTQTIDGAAKLYTDNRVTAENFRLVLSHATAASACPIASVIIGALPQGPTARY